MQTETDIHSDSKSVQRYRRVNLYDAETGKRSTKSLKRIDFKCEEDLEAAADELKAAQRRKNADYKTAKIAANVSEGIARAKKNDLIEKVVSIVEPIPPPYHSPEVSLRLDAGTGNTTVIYGSSKRGKTTLMMHLYKRYYADKKNICTMFSGNPHLKVYKGDKNLLIGYGFTPRHAKYIQMQQVINVKTKNKYSFVNLFDDIIDSKYSSIINKMVLTYRNANISMIMCLQYVCMFSKANRGSINNTFVFGANSTEDARGIIDKVLRSYLVDLGFKDINSQLAFYKMITADHGFFYIDNIKGTMSFHRLVNIPPP